MGVKYIEGMPIGPGKYDKELNRAIKSANATGGLLLILDGNKGASYSCYWGGAIPIHLPDILEQMAKQIRENFEP